MSSRAPQWHEALLLAVSAKLQRFCTACWLGSDAAFHPLPGGKYTANARPVNKKLTRSAAETLRKVMQGAGLNQDSLCLKLCFTIRDQIGVTCRSRTNLSLNWFLNAGKQPWRWHLCKADSCQQTAWSSCWNHFTMVAHQKPF